MDFLIAHDSTFFSFVVLPFLIFAARILDVTLGTLRIMYIQKGYIYFAPVLGFLESLIWLLAISQLIKHLTHPLYYIAFASGFATGNFAGIWLERKLAMGLICVRIITADDTAAIVQKLSDLNIGVTTVEALGVHGKVRLLWTVIQRKQLDVVYKLIGELAPKAFVSVDDIRSASGGVFAQEGIDHIHLGTPSNMVRK